MIFLSLLLTLNLSCATSLNPGNIKIDLVVPDRPFFAGEIVYLEARLKNISDKEIFVPIRCNDVLACNYEFRIYDEKGNYIASAPYAPDRRGKTLNGGESYVYRVPFYLYTRRAFNEDKRFRVKAVYGWKEDDFRDVIESEEKWVDVLAPKTEEDKAAYHLLYSLWLNAEKEIPNAYSAGLSGYTLIPAKYPASIYTKYALFIHGKDCVELDSQKYINQGLSLLSRVLNEFPSFSLTDETLYYCGLAHQKLGEKEKALELYNKAIKEYPGSDGAEMASKAITDLGQGK